MYYHLPKACVFNHTFISVYFKTIMLIILIINEQKIEMKK